MSFLWLLLQILPLLFIVAALFYWLGLRQPRADLADSLASLALDGLDPFPSRREVRIARARAVGSNEADQARALLAEMPPDPDAEWHRIVLRTALL